MKVRYAKGNEKQNVIDIWNYCFNDEEAFVDYYFNRKYNHENTIVLEEDNKIISSLQLNQYTVKLNNKEYKTSYVVGVSTLPEARGRGCMKCIMDYSLNEMYRKNQLVSLLMPIDYRLYRKYGYEHCYDQIEYNLKTENLSGYKSKGKFEELNDDNLEVLVQIYDKITKKLNGVVIRDCDYYKDMREEVKSENGKIYLYNENGYKGYIVYFINGDNLFVKELYTTNKEALESMLRFIYNHNTQCKQVIIMSHLNDKIRYIIHNLKDIEIKLKPFMMGRIIKAKEYIEHIEINECKDIETKIYIQDNQIEENNGVFKLEIKNNKIKMFKSEGDYDYKIDINKLSQLSFSYISFEDIVELQGLDIDEISDNTRKIFEQIFNTKTNYINEYV